MLDGSTSGSVPVQHEQTDNYIHACMYRCMYRYTVRMYILQAVVYVGTKSYVMKSQFY